MQIDRIKITNFKSVRELDLNFQEMTGLWEISGVVGAGKTTIGEAIIFALFGAVRGKTNESLITWGKKHTLVEAWVYCKNRHIHIRREINSYGQSPLTAEVDGEEILGSDKRSIQGILENEWYDISRQTLELLCVISFNNFKSLSTLSTADSREFLNSTIAFDKIDEYENYCKEQIKEHEEKIRKFEGDKREQEGALKVLTESKEELNKLKPKTDNVEEVKRLEKETLDAFNKYKAETIKHHKELDADWKVKNDQYKAAGVALKNLETNFKKLKDGICPVCGQPVTPEHRVEMENEIEHRKEMVEHLGEVANIYAKKVQDYGASVSHKLEELDDKHSLAKWEVMKVTEYRERLELVEKKCNACQEKITIYEKGIEECVKHVNDWKEMFDFLRDTVRPTIIASIIPSINKYITYYMGQVHQNYVVFYDENFKCMMKNTFGEPIPLSSLSTGQKKVIDMVIILAFIKTFITQIDFNIYFMDELIGNIDADLRDIMCALLKDTLDEKDVMFLISHSPINQVYLDGVIKVTMSSGISEYSVINIAK